MTTTEFHRIEDARTARMLRELASDLADLVESDDLTEAEANERMVAKQDQWAGGMS